MPATTAAQPKHFVKSSISSIRVRFWSWVSNVLAAWLASTMTRAHGGTWKSHIDQDLGFILIQPRRSRSRVPAEANVALLASPAE